MIAVGRPHVTYVMGLRSRRCSEYTLDDSSAFQRLSRCIVKSAFAVYVIVVTHITESAYLSMRDLPFLTPHDFDRFSLLFFLEVPEDLIDIKILETSVTKHTEIQTTSFTVLP